MGIVASAQNRKIVRRVASEDIMDLKIEITKLYPLHESTVQFHHGRYTIRA